MKISPLNIYICRKCGRKKRKFHRQSCALRCQRSSEGKAMQRNSIWLGTAVKGSNFDSNLTFWLRLSIIADVVGIVLIPINPIDSTALNAPCVCQKLFCYRSHHKALCSRSCLPFSWNPDGEARGEKKKACDEKHHQKRKMYMVKVLFIRELAQQSPFYTRQRFHYMLMPLMCNSSQQWISFFCRSSRFFSILITIPSTGVTRFLFW